MTLGRLPMTPFRPLRAAAALFGVALIALPALSLAQSSRVIINRGATQKASVTIRTDSNVNIDPISGNVIIDCQPSAADPNECLDPIGSGGVTLPPAFSIAGSNFSNSPDPTNGKYPAATTFTISPVGLNSQYEACQRIVTGGGGSTNWNGLTVAGAATLTNVTLPNPESTYNFSLRCFATGGARTSNTLTYMTLPGIPPVVGNCPPNDLWVGEGWAGFTRSPKRLITELRKLTGGFISPFPYFAGLAVVGARRNEYLAVEFTAIPNFDANGDGTISIADFPSSKILNWTESQGGGAGPSNVDEVYMTISKCPGDLRLPPAGNPISTTDPTFNLGCRGLSLSGGVRSIRAAIGYSINDAPNNTTCSLVYGEKYFLNFVTVNPLDGYQTDEHSCNNPNGECGVQMQSL